MARRKAKKKDSPTASRVPAPEGWPVADFFPADVYATAGEYRRTLWALVLLGAAARLMQYLLRFPLWQDEAFQAVNLLERAWLGLLRPLEFSQVCPPLALWAQKLAVQCFGFTEYALRLPWFVMGLASLLLFFRLSERVLSGVARVVAVGLFAASDLLIRYSAEGKPYGGDVFVALLLLMPAIEWLRDGRTGWLWLLAALAPLGFGLSNTAAFVCGGISVAVLWRLIRTGVGFRDGGTLVERSGGSRPALAFGRPPLTWLAFVCFNVAVVASFVAVLALYSARGAEAKAAVEQFWQNAFPPLAEPLRLAIWTLRVHFRELLEYPLRGGGFVIFPLAIVGLVWFGRRGRGDVVLLAVVPALLQLVAAALKKYPYGGSPRFSLYLAPLACLAAGLAISWLLYLIRVRRAGWLPVGPRLAMVLLGGMTVGVTVHAIVRPYQTEVARRARELCRAIWQNESQGAELVSLYSDLGKDFNVRPLGSDFSALWYCNQQIYWTRLALGLPPRMDRVGPHWPLRVALLRSTVLGPFDQQAYERWTAEMDERYRLTSMRRDSFTFFDKDPRPLYVDVIEVREYVPRGGQ